MLSEGLGSLEETEQEIITNGLPPACTLTTSMLDISVETGIESTTVTIQKLGDKFFQLDIGFGFYSSDSALSACAQLTE